MTFGINTFLFAGSFTNESVSLFEQFAGWGFDSVEIAMDDPSVVDSVLVSESLARHGLVCGSVCAAMGPGRDLRGSATDQRTARAYLESCIRLLPRLGCSILAGPLYSAVGRAALESPEAYRAQWKTVVEHLKELGEYAKEHGVTLAVEPLNRYETDFLNTVSQAVSLLEEVGHPNVRLHLDSYHMNIEEKHPSQAILRAGHWLAHFHACGTDRGTPGKDHIDWVGITNALKSTRYQGSVVIESFTPAVEVIAKAASIWRDIEPSQEAIASEGLDFLKSLWSKAA